MLANKLWSFKLSILPYTEGVWHGNLGWSWGEDWKLQDRTSRALPRSRWTSQAGWPTFFIPTCAHWKSQSWIFWLNKIKIKLFLKKLLSSVHLIDLILPNFGCLFGRGCEVTDTMNDLYAGTVLYSLYYWLLFLGGNCLLHPIP